MLKIWGRATSLNVQKVMWAVGELGLAHSRVDAGGRFGGLDSLAYRALNPNALVPTIEDEGAVVWESNACVRYLAARYGEGELWDKDPGRRAMADRWMDWMQTTLAPDLYATFWAAVRIAPARQDKAAIAAAARRLASRYELIDLQLAATALARRRSLLHGRHSDRRDALPLLRHGYQAPGPHPSPGLVRPSARAPGLSDPCHGLLRGAARHRLTGKLRRGAWPPAASIGHPGFRPWASRRGCKAKIRPSASVPSSLPCRHLASRSGSRA